MDSEKDLFDLLTDENRELEPTEKEDLNYEEYEEFLKEIRQGY